MLTEQSRNDGLSVSKETADKFKEMVEKANLIRYEKTLEENNKVDSVATDKK